MPITISPKRKHRYLSRKVAYLCYHTVCIAAVHEVIIHAIAHIRPERGLFLVIREKRGGIIVPIQAIAFGRLEEGTDILHVPLNHVLPHAPLRHFPVLQLSQPVNGLVRIELESLIHVVGGIACVVKGNERLLHRLLGKQKLAISRPVGKCTGRRVKVHLQDFGVHHDGTILDTDLDPDLARRGHDRQALLLKVFALGRLDHPHHRRREELHLHVNPACGGFNAVSRFLVILGRQPCGTNQSAQHKHCLSHTCLLH